MAENHWIDPTRPSAARIYDYMLGGAHNFEADRIAAAAMLERFPEARLAGHANRDFLRRVVTCCCERGITQFLDLDSGIPTAGNVHDIARRHHPEARVAYVDIEAVAVAHSYNVLVRIPGVSITQADLRLPAQVLTAPGIAGLLDFTRPIAVLAVAALHHVSPADDLSVARIEATPPAVWADGLDRLAETDVLDELPQLTMAVDVVVGEGDHGAKPEHSRKIADVNAQARFHLIPRAGFLVALEDAQVVAHLLRAGDGAPAGDQDGDSASLVSR